MIRSVDKLLMYVLSMAILGSPCAISYAAGESKPPLNRFPTAEEISRQILPQHPKARDAAEQKIIDVMDDMVANQARGMGNISPEDGRMMRMLTESVKAKKVVELGTSNGYSALWFSLAVRSTGGKVITHEIDPTRIKMAKANFERARVKELITLVEGDAHQTIRNLDGPIDVLLLDAEKEGFVDYLNQLLPKVRVGGLIIAHDSSGQADQLTDYFPAIINNDDLESVLIDASKWGMCITRKMR
ncbi:putative O-methyltransferase [Planctomycetes bacterium CA13]|uniref:Putative O-methyltransferase n=1 Tax=Novipirellula herctigrandis TaxID=2527986 RepID=A0A5C5YV33_9BACT|nr:putative O-methyltransferase [Planctomycetes bacterium CA13]